MKRVGDVILVCTASMAAFVMGAFLVHGNVNAKGIRSLRGDGTIPEGVYVDDMDMSGLTPDEARQRISARIEELSDSVITVHGVTDDQRFSFRAGETGLTAADIAELDEIVSAGSSGNPVRRYMELKDLEHDSIRYELHYEVSESRLTEIVETNAAGYDQKRKDWKLAFQDGKFVMTEGQTGYHVDVAASAKRIRDYMESDWEGTDADVSLAIEVDEALGNRDELAAVKDVLGTYTTSYKTSGAARSANVANGCRLINGTLVYPGEEFSVLDTITPFTEANGYYPAGSYLNGLVVESVGGGICQVSTTLYNAVLRAELEVTERHNHSMIVNYVSPSADAAIAETGGKNFRFVNNLQYPIYIEGHTADKKITFTIYGCETRSPDHKIDFESEVLETTPAGPDQINADGSKPIGFIDRQSAHIGYKARLWKIVTENGKSERQEVNKSTYKMVPTIYTVGTATSDPASAAWIGAAIATGSIDEVRAVANAIAAGAQPAPAPAEAQPAPEGEQAAEYQPEPEPEGQPVPEEPSSELEEVQQE